MALTMLEQTMREGYICMCEYILNVNILSNIQYQIEQIYIIETTTTRITCLQEVNWLQWHISCIYIYL